MARRLSPRSESSSGSATGSLCCCGCMSNRRTSRYMSDRKAHFDEKAPLCSTPSILSRNSTTNPRSAGVQEQWCKDLRASATSPAALSVDQSHSSMKPVENSSLSPSTESATETSEGCPRDNSCTNSPELTMAKNTTADNGLSETKGSQSCPVMPVTCPINQSKLGNPSDGERVSHLPETTTPVPELEGNLLPKLTTSEETVNHIGDFRSSQCCLGCERDEHCACKSKHVHVHNAAVYRGKDSTYLQEVCEKPLSGQSSERSLQYQDNSHVGTSVNSAGEQQPPSLTHQITEMVRRYIYEPNVSDEDDDTEDQLERDVLWFLSRMRAEVRNSNLETQTSA